MSIIISLPMLLLEYLFIVVRVIEHHVIRRKERKNWQREEVGCKAVQRIHQLTIAANWCWTSLQQKSAKSFLFWDLGRCSPKVRHYKFWGLDLENNLRELPNLVSKSFRGDDKKVVVLVFSNTLQKPRPIKSACVTITRIFQVNFSYQTLKLAPACTPLRCIRKISWIVYT